MTVDSDIRPWSAPNERAGFTLVETIIALVILSIGILAVATLSSTSIWQVRRGQDLTNSTMAAQQVMEVLSRTPYDSVPEGAYSDSVRVGEIVYRIVWNVVDVTDSLATGGARLKRVTVYAGGGLAQPSPERFEMAIYGPGGGT